MPDVLHEDDPGNTEISPDGQVVYCLTAEEWAARAAVGTTHGVPAGMLASAMADLDRAEREGGSPS